MDRGITYTGQLIPNSALLGREKAKLLSSAALSKAILGTNTVVDGLALAPTTVPSMQVVVGLGSIYSLQTVDASAFGDLGTDSHTVLKQGLLADPVTLTLTAPSTSGYSQYYLVQAALVEQDGGSTVLPYYNAANPSAPFNGPANAGTSQNTLRQDLCAVAMVAGAAASTGTQTVPAATPGYTPLYTILVANGQTTITSTAFATVSGAPFIPAPLPGVPAGVQSGAWVYGIASGTNTYVATLFSTAAYPFALATGMEILVYFGNANTGTSPSLNANGTGAKSILRQGGGAPAAGDISGFVPLVYDGTAWRVNGLVISDITGSTATTNQINILAGTVNRTRYFLTPGTFTFTVPAANQPDGTTTLWVCFIGGGGAGGASGTGAGGGISGNIGGGGGGGGRVRKTITGLTPGSSISITIGAGGIAYSSSAGGNGGASSFGAYCTAGGGHGGDSGTNSSSAIGVGGTATGGDANDPGQDGGFTGNNSATVSTSDIIRIYGRGGMPTGAGGTSSLSGTGAAGNGHGAGGTGASGGSGLAGGAGAPGEGEVRW